LTDLAFQLGDLALLLSDADSVDYFVGEFLGLVLLHPEPDEVP
jgi:hypothetical protein